jgi:MtrB/PioB family decaheme-associated outer membrane protein
VQADYDYVRGTRLGFGYDLDERERTFQEVEETTEDSIWGSIRVRNIENLFLEFRLATSRREASSSEVVASIDPPQNQLMTKYNLADRDRNSISMHASFLPADYYSVGVSMDFARDDYDQSELGLTKSNDTSINIDFTAMVTEETTVNAFVGHQEIESEQAGSASFAEPDWFADVNDSFNYFGIGFTHVLIEGELNIGADFSRANSRGEIDIDSAVPGAPFPDLVTELDTLRLYLDYRIDDNMTLRAAYWHEEYDSDDWALDGLDPDTVGNLLALGMESPSYNNDVVKLSMSYRF